MDHSLEGDLLNSNSLDHHWSYAGWDVREDKKILDVTMYLPEDEVVCRPLRPWWEEPEEKLNVISNGNAGNIEKDADLPGLILLVADWEKSRPGRADVPVHFRNARPVHVEF
jgi:hypothetical protein